jgi:HD-GYP domain-containing protein (c-di-GMP phosphodiesterase class II)
MQLRPVTLESSLIGDFLPWDLYTANGVLVARSGIRVANASHFAELSSRPLFRRHLDMFDHSNEARDPSAELRRMMNALPETLQGVRQPGFELALRAYARTLMYFSRRNHDALLGLARLMPMNDSAARHCLISAIIAIGLARHLELPNQYSESLACAALTMNLAALRLHADLADGERGFGDSAQMIIRHHPERSSRLLEASGIKDPDWLDAVRQHHENLDGSGYPNGLRDQAICLPARLLRVADFYVAKITGRRNRPPKSAKFALNLILFENERERLDAEYAKLLLHRYGLYPSGTLVRLESQEIAVITRNHGRCGSTSQAMSFMRQRGRLLAFPVEHDISTPGYQVIDVLEREAYRSKLPWDLFWRDWT